MTTILQKRYVKTLAGWLKIATGELAASAKERIEAEIEAHYAEAVQGHLENGLSEADAQASALAELGDPTAAAKRFRKRHLTKREAQLIMQLVGQTRSIYWLLFSYFLFAGHLLVYLLHPRDTMIQFHFPLLYIAAAFLVFVLLPTTSLVAARSSQIKPGRRWWVLMPAGGYSPIIYYSVLFQPTHSTFELLIRITCFSSFLVAIFFGFRISKKLGNDAQIWNQLSSPKAAKI